MVFKMEVRKRWFRGGGNGSENIKKLGVGMVARRDAYIHTGVHRSLLQKSFETDKDLCGWTALLLFIIATS